MRRGTHPNSMFFNEEFIFIIKCFPVRISDQVIVNEATTSMVLTETNVAKLCAARRC